MRHLTGSRNYFEDFVPGQRIRHAQGRTVGPEHAVFTLQCMNGVQLHFNADFCAIDPVVKERFGGRVVIYGGYVLALVRGLASQDTSENALAEPGFANGRHLKPVHEGDTLYAESEVLAVSSDPDPEGGLVRFLLRGLNQRDEVVLEIERDVVVKRRPSG
ncbi:MAG TPA: MaoC family dehydratase [Candidatus Eisenbacteria bacterium]|jgi:acyl dehydratase